MVEHVPGCDSSYDALRKKKPYGIDDERAPKRKLSIARKSNSVHAKSNTELTTQNRTRSVEDCLTWKEPEGKSFQVTMSPDQDFRIRYLDGSFRPPGEEIQPTLQQALLWSRVRKLKSQESSRSQELHSYSYLLPPSSQAAERQVRARRLKRNFESKSRLERIRKDHHRVKRIEAMNDIADSAEKANTAAILKNIEMLPCGFSPTGFSLTARSALVDSTGIMSIDMLNSCDTFQLHASSSKLHHEPPESSENAELKILGLVSHRDECHLKGNLLDGELERATKLCFGRGLNRWLTFRNMNKR